MGEDERFFDKSEPLGAPPQEFRRDFHFGRLRRRIDRVDFARTWAGLDWGVRRGTAARIRSVESASAWREGESQGSVPH